MALGFGAMLLAVGFAPRIGLFLRRRPNLGVILLALTAALTLAVVLAKRTV